MTAPQPQWVVGDTHPNVGSRSATSAAFNADIGALNAAKGEVGIAPVRAVFESVIGILALVRVRPVPAPLLLRQLAKHATRTN